MTSIDPISTPSLDSGEPVVPDAALEIVADALEIDDDATVEEQLDAIAEIAVADATDNLQAASGSSETMPEDLLEELPTVIIDILDDSLQESDTQDDVGEALDGETEETRTSGEQEAIDDTFEDVTEGDALDVQVVVVRPGYSQRYITDDGQVLWFKLKRGEDFRLIETPSGERIMLVSNEISTEDLVDEVLNFVSEEIEDAAVENGVNVLDGFQDRFSAFFRRPILGDIQEFVSLYYQQILILDAVYAADTLDIRETKRLMDKLSLKEKLHPSKSLVGGYDSKIGGGRGSKPL